MTAYFALLQSTGHRKLLFNLYITSRYYVCLIYSVKTYVALTFSCWILPFLFLKG